ncbi:hypothetical protein AC1031_011589 [Aphanomyces cochlioides]|nr:hypothetical protein AC1031_011589 [Aphanomyces cochlioides]
MADSSDQLSDRTLPGRAYYREEAVEGGSLDLAARRREIDALVYEDDGVSVVDITEMDVDQDLTLAQPMGSLLLPSAAPDYPVVIEAQPRLAVQSIALLHEQTAVHQEVHHHYPPPDATNVGHTERDRLLVAQADELARQTIKTDTMQLAGMALEQEMSVLRQALETERSRASRAEAMVKELQVRETESRRQMDAVLDAKQRMEDIAAEFRQRDAERGRVLQNERLARSLAGVKAEPSPSASTAPSPNLDNGVRLSAPLLSGFSAPKAPRYVGYTLDARRQFAKQYYEYCNECAQAALSLGTRIGIRPIGSCLDAKAKRFAAMMHFGRDAVSISNQEWTEYFQHALNYHNPGFGDLEAKIRTTVVMDEKELDPDRCYDKWVYAYWSLLDENNMISIGAAAQAKQKAVKCWSCGGPHHIAKCESTSDADKSTIRAKHAESKRTNGGSGVSSDGKSESKGVARIDGKAESKKGSVIFKAKALQWPDCPPRDGSCWAVVIHGGLDEPVPALLDSGCDSGLVVSQGLAERLSTTSNLDLQLTVLPNTQVMEGFGGVPLTLSRHLVVPELALLVGDTPILLTSVSAWVDDTDPALAITVGRPIMKVLGYSTEGLLRNAAASPSVYDMGHLSVLDHDTSALCRALRAQRAHLDAEDDAKDDFDDDEVLMTSVSVALQAKIVEAKEHGLSESGSIRLSALLAKYDDVFRLDFCQDPPVSVEPLEVRFKKDATPTTCKARRYSPLQTDFLRTHLGELVKAGLARRTNRSRWCSPPRLVPKKDGSLRMTVDT